MIASNVETIDGREVGCFPRSSEVNEYSEAIRIVVVAGLLHGNGVIDLLSKE
jgi:hypothetical protein